MIRGERDNDGIVTAAKRVFSAGSYCRPGIAPDRFEQDIGFCANRGQLLGDQKPILAVGYDDRTAEQRRVGHAANGFLEGRQRTKQR